MFKDNRYINAGQNEIYRYGKKAVEKAQRALTPNDAGFYSIPVDGGKYWTLGTSTGKYGEFVNINGTIFSVNKGGYAWAKADSEKGEKFVAAIKSMIESMNQINGEREEAEK